MANQEFTPLKPNQTTSTSAMNSPTTDSSSSTSTSDTSTFGSSATERATQGVKDVAANAAQQSKEMAAKVTEGAKEGVNQVADEATKMAQELSGEVKQMASDAAQQAEGRVNEQKGYAADRLAGIANALRESGNSFRSQDEAAFATYADSAADQVERFSGYLRDQNVNDLARDVKQLAKSQPELFVAGALAAGFFLGRFFKSSDQQNLSAQQRDGYARRYDQYGASNANRGYRPAYNQAGSSSYSDQFNSRYGAPRDGEPAYPSQVYADQRPNNQYGKEYGNERSRYQNNGGNYPSGYGASSDTVTTTGRVASSKGSEAQSALSTTQDLAKSNVQYEHQAYVADSKVTDKQYDNSTDKPQRDQNNTRKEK